MAERRVAVIGGGITGLSAAYYLQQKAQAAGLPVAVTVIERDRRLGGKVQTEHVDGLTIEQGPDSFLSRKPWALALIRELGLQDHLVGLQPGLRAFVLHRGRLQRLPEGLMLGVPTRLGPLLQTPLLSWGGKLRAGLDLVLARRTEQGDESFGHFLSRRLGREVVTNLAEPLLAGSYGGAPDRLSLAATYPQFLDLERRYGSVIRGLLVQAAAARAKPGGGEASAFVTLDTGLGGLIDALADRLQDAQVLTGTAVHSLERTDAGYVLGLDDGQQLAADSVVVATPAFATAPLIQGVAPAVAAEVEAITYGSSAVVAVVCRRADVRHPLNGTGFVIPSGEQAGITAATFMSVKWPFTADPERVLVRCFVGRPGKEQMLALSDDDMLAVVRRDLRAILGIEAAPVLQRVYRWEKANPFYDVGHLQRMERIQAGINAVPGLVLAGAAYRGLGVPDCIREGQQAADQVLAFLVQSRS